jgi:hypothetical protein
MQQMIRTSTLATAAMLALAACAPLSTLGGGPPAKAAAKPDEQKKVWTNDDVVRLNPEYVAGKQALVIAVVPPTFVVTEQGPKPAPVVVAVPISPQQNPAWYGAQLEDLQAELSAVEAHEAQLRNFRATSTGMPTGLVLDAPVEGITTDNLIANLDAQRQGIAAQIDALEDLARTNGFAPGALVASAGPEPSVGEQKDALVHTIQESSGQLAGIRLIQSTMQQQVADLHGTLRRPTPGFGGNMTTDLLERLDGRASALESTIDRAGDAARSLGAEPGEVR